MTKQVPEPIATFFDTPTPAAWVGEACKRLPELLLDHANCELKAASTALGFIYRYPDRTALASMHLARAVLSAGGVLVWFPEGRRSPTGEGMMG